MGAYDTVISAGANEETPLGGDVGKLLGASCGRGNLTRC